MDQRCDAPAEGLECLPDALGQAGGQVQERPVRREFARHLWCRLAFCAQKAMHFFLIVFCSGFCAQKCQAFFLARFCGPRHGQQVFPPVSDLRTWAFFVGRTLFRSFDENADGTVSQHEFRKGVRNLGYSTL